MHGLLLDAAMNFAINSALAGRGPDPGHPRDEGRDHAPGQVGEAYRLRGEVVRMARQVAYAEATVTDDGGPAGQSVDRHLPAPPSSEPELEAERPSGLRAGPSGRPGTAEESLTSVDIVACYKQFKSGRLGPQPAAGRPTSRGPLVSTDDDPHRWSDRRHRRCPPAARLGRTRAVADPGGPGHPPARGAAERAGRGEVGGPGRLLAAGPAVRARPRSACPTWPTPSSSTCRR